MGFTPFPYDITAEAVASTDDFVGRNGDLVALHFDDGVPWTEALADGPFHPNLEADWARRKRLTENHKTFLAVTPLDGGRKGLALYRGERDNMPIPDPFAGKPLNDPAVKAAFKAYCRRAVDYFRPHWCAITIEANELILNAPAAWPAYLELYRETYADLKARHPTLPLCATVTLHALTDPAKADKNGQRAKVRAFLGEVDFAGISYYPFMAGNLSNFTTPLAWIRSFTAKPLALAETGFHAETIVLESFKLTLPSTPALQQKFYEDTLRRALSDNYLFVVSFLHRDYDALWARLNLPEFLKVWKDCGLIDEAGKERPALAVWKRYLDLKLVPAGSAQRAAGSSASGAGGALRTRRR